jgi:hypothetical protein
VIVGCNCLKKQTTDEKKLAKYTHTPARHVPLSNDILLREAFSTSTFESNSIWTRRYCARLDSHSTRIRANGLANPGLVPNTTR